MQCVMLGIASGRCGSLRVRVKSGVRSKIDYVSPQPNKNDATQPHRLISSKNISACPFIQGDNVLLLQEHICDATAI